MSGALLTGPQLREWQQESFDEWTRLGHRGVVEAVTGTGKTTLGIHTAADGMSRGLAVLVAVPGIELLNQWFTSIIRVLPHARVGRRGGGFRDDFSSCDILVSTVHSAIAASAPRPIGSAMLIADEVHRYGASSFSQLLTEEFSERLGLTATFERSDNGVEDYLRPYFEHVIAGCDYTRGHRDGILAPVRVMQVAIPFSSIEQARYTEFDETAKKEQFALINQYGCRSDVFGDFMVDVQSFSEGSAADPATRAARRFLNAFSKRRELLAECSGKQDTLRSLGEVLKTSGRALIFSETKRSSQIAAEALLEEGVLAAPYTSDLKPAERRELLEAFRVGEMTALVAPKVLDEGVDVPEADVGIILAGSKSRRQMIQRMGRIIRPKADGRDASFLHFFVEGTSEDPATGAHGTFLEQLTDIAAEVVTVSPGDAPGLLARWLASSPHRPSRLSGSESAATARRLIEEPVTELKDDQPLVEGEQIRGIIRKAVASSNIDAVDSVLACVATLPPVQVMVLIARYGLAGVPPDTYDDIGERIGLSVSAVKETEQMAVEALSQSAAADVLAGVM